MANNRDITSANATIIMLVDELYPQGVRLEQFSTDAMASEGDETFSETRMGVDGQMVAGYVDDVKSVTITIEPSSPSITYMETLQNAMRSNRKIYPVTLLINIPATGRTITCSNGVLKTGKLLPDMNKTLQPIAYVFDFEKIA